MAAEGIFGFNVLVGILFGFSKKFFILSVLGECFEGVWFLFHFRKIF
jgi:hypothetical protein